MKTKKTFSNWRSGVLAASLLLFACWSADADFQLVSSLDGSVSPPAGGNGDSYLPVISPDGRYVLFASTANNLVLTNNNGPVPSTSLHNMNVFLRDRVLGTTKLVSVNPAGNGGNGNSFPTGISTNGQFALFESAASDLAPGVSNNTFNVYVRDMVNGTTTLVSVSTNGVGGNGNSRSSVITPDGRYVAFVSEANNLVSNDTNGIPDVFVRDLKTGTTTLVSIGAISTGSTIWPNGSESPAITPDGRYVAFDSTATNLVVGVRSSGEVYVRDLVARTTTWASTNALSLFQSVFGTSNAFSCHQVISTNGQFVAFETCTTNLTTFNAQGIVQRYNLQTGLTDIVCTNANAPLTSPLENINNLDMTPDGRFIAYVANGTGNSGNTMIYLWDAQSGTNILVSADMTSGLPVSGTCDMPVVNSTGQYVAFLSNGTNLTANPLNLTTNISALAGGYNLYWRDTQAGVTELVDADTNGVGIGVDSQTVPVLSDDGSLVFFSRIDGDLVANDNNRDWDVFARNVTNGTTELISVHNPALPSQTPPGFNMLYSTSVSTNGRYIAFASDADDLAPNDTNGYRDVFVRDLLLGTNILVSVATNGFTTTNMSTEPSISGDGRYVAFSSDAASLVPGDGNNARDVFVRDLQAGTTELVSSNMLGGSSSSANADSYSPTISSDGRYVLFRSKANNLTAGISSAGTENLFLRDLEAATNYALTTWTGGSSSPGVLATSMTPDGHYVAFVAAVNYGGFLNNLFVWDSHATRMIYTNNLPFNSFSSILNASISSDGRWVTFITSGNNASTLWVYDLVGQTNYQICSGSLTGFPSRPGLQFSTDDRYLVFSTQAALSAADTNGTYDVYLHDFLTGSNLLVSQSFNSTSAANGTSDSPAISPDGRFIAYRSLASNIVPDDTNGVADLFLFDRSNNATMLLTVNQGGSSSANSWSLLPVFSGDGGTLVFESYDSNLPGPGYNEWSAIWAFDLSSFPVVVGSGGSGTGSSNSEFYVQLVPANSTTPYPGLSWPLSPGNSYQVQFKNDLSDTNWQNVDGSIIFVGGTAQINDLSPSPDRRFYRVVLNNPVPQP